MTIQVLKDYGGDWAKSKSRDLIRNMAKKTLLGFKRPEFLRVLCLPGVDAAEVIEVYDPLGIPRANIVGIERDAQVAEILRRRNLGIKIVEKDIEDYVKSERGFDFDIISLDYTGPLTWGHVDTLRRICEKQGLNHFLLHHANLAKRDRGSYSMYHVGAGFAEVAFKKLEDQPIGNLRAFNHLTNKLSEAGEKLVGKGDKKEIKSASYSALIKAAYMGSDIKVLDRMLKFTSGNYYSGILKFIQRDIIDHMKLTEKLDREAPLEGLAKNLGHMPSLWRFFEEQMYESLSHDLRILAPNLSGFEWSVYASLAEASKEAKSFRSKSDNHYSYISESGAPMIGDIYYLSYSQRLRELHKEVARLLGWPESLGCNSPTRLYETLLKLNSEDRRIGGDQGADLGCWRTFLGSSAKPVLTKQRAIEEFEKGLSVEEIKDRYRGWNGKPLSQWKAHVTMGTYETSKGNEEIIEHEEDSDLEKITKEEAVELISSGIPIEEIYETYPTSFTLGQLRAHKAHVTMGTYENKG